jgi:hypothetical protein
MTVCSVNLNAQAKKVTLQVTNADYARLVED